MNMSERDSAVNKFNNFVIPKAKARNEQFISSAPLVTAQLELTGIPQSITDNIYNEAKVILEYGSVFRKIWESFFLPITTDQNTPFQISINENGNKSCKRATCPRFMLFKVYQHIIVVQIEQQILEKFIGLWNREERVQFINMVNTGKEKKCWGKENEINAKGKRSNREKCYGCGRNFYE